MEFSTMCASIRLPYHSCNLEIICATEQVKINVLDTILEKYNFKP